MTRGLFAFWMTAVCATGQVTVLVANGVDGLWPDEEGFMIQVRDTLYRVSGEPPRVASAEGAKVPSRAAFFDTRGERELWVGATAWGSALDDEGSVELGGALLRRPLAGPPIRLPLLFDGGGAVIPARPAFLLRWSSGTGAAFRPLPVALDGSLELGWGAGDPLQVDLILPHLIPLRGDGGVDLIVGAADRWARHGDGVAPVALSPPPTDREEGILEFPFSVPPVCADLDGDGRDELVFVDPSAGSATVYWDPEGAAPTPGRVILVDGLCLAAWAGEFDGDGRNDLMLLRARKPGLAGQLKVLSRGVLSAEAMFYPGLADGTLATSPRSRCKVDLGLRIGIRNEVREAAFTTLCVPRPGPALVVSDVEGTLQRRSFDGDAPTALGELPAGEALDAFRVIPWADGIALRWRTPADERVVWLKGA